MQSFGNDGRGSGHRSDFSLKVPAKPGLIYGVYDAKPGGFVPGAMSLHNALIAHGPDAEAFDKATHKDLLPERLSGTMAFMLETRYPLSATAYASQLELLDGAYSDCWDGLSRKFARS